LGFFFFSFSFLFLSGHNLFVYSVSHWPQAQATLKTSSAMPPEGARTSTFTSPPARHSHATISGEELASGPTGSTGCEGLSGGARPGRSWQRNALFDFTVIIDQGDLPIITHVK
jgi:hypothetical protein